MLQCASVPLAFVQATVPARSVDNGCGFDVTAPLRKGLQSMRERAQAIGATLSLHSAPGRTVLKILIH